MSRRRSSRLYLLLALAGTAHSLLAQTPVIEVQVYDYAGLQPESLRKATALTQEILAGAGISIQVNLCRAKPAVSCESDTGTARRLVLRMIAGRPKTMDSVLRPPLARSIAGSEGGTYASIFLERIKDAAAEADVPWELVLAYAAAHEVGHLLLGGGSAHRPGLDERHLGP